MVEEPEIPTIVIPLTLLAGFLSLICSISVAFPLALSFGGTLHGWDDVGGVAFMLLLLMAFPIFLSSLYSMKRCRNWITAYGAVYLLVRVIGEANHFNLVHFLADFWTAGMLAMVASVNAAYFLIKRALRGYDERIPGFINIMTR